MATTLTGSAPLALRARHASWIMAIALGVAAAGGLVAGCMDSGASSLTGRGRPAFDEADGGGDEEAETSDDEEAPAPAVEQEVDDRDATVEDAAADAGAPKPPRLPLLKAGLHPDASDALRVLGVKAEQVVQTIGNAAASAGTHGKDGTVDGADYSAAVDISVRGMSDAQIKKLLGDMTQYGFAGWYRKPGADGWPADEYPHFHLIYAGAAMKLSLRNQCRAFFAHRNGLVSNTTYQYFTWSQAHRDAVKAVYLTKNPASG